MRPRPLLVAPLALLGGGCAGHPFTPSLSLRYWFQPVPEGVARTVPSFESVFDAWQLSAANPWSPWCKATLITALEHEPVRAELPDVARLDVVRKARAAATRVASVGLPERTLFVVDLRGAASVAFGTQLSQLARTPVANVATFNNWPADDEMIPAEETLAAMVTMQPRQPPELVAATPLFLLDAWRLAWSDAVAPTGWVDNRYLLNASDLPQAEALRDRGIERVVYLVESLDEAMHEEDDLNATLLGYRAQGIPIAMVDLDLLARLPTQPSWPSLLAEHALDVEPRKIVIDDPGFYLRSTGGFGGIHAGPSPYRIGMSGHAGGGGWGGGGWGHGGGG